MTEPAAGTRDAVRAMVGAALPGWNVASVGCFEGCANGVYPVTVTDDHRRKELVVKARGRTDRASFRPEPYLLDAVARRTDVPVPGVVAVVDDHDDHPAFFLMEHCDGERPPERPDGLVPPVRDRLAREAGRFLGELHLLGSFDRFGPLRVTRTDRDDGSGRPTCGDGAHPSGGPDRPPGGRSSGGRPDGRSGGHGDDRTRGPPGTTEADQPRAERALPEQGIEEPGFTVDVADAGHEAWAGWFRALAERRVAALDGRFADLADGVTRSVEAVDLPDPTPVLAHDDYRYRNLLADTATGETRAVLDFEESVTAAARYDLVGTVDRLSAWAPLDADRRRRVRECILVGYETVTGRRPDLDAPACDAYRLAARLPALAAVDRWEDAVCPDERDAVAARHRDYVRTLVGRCLDGA